MAIQGRVKPAAERRAGDADDIGRLGAAHLMAAGARVGASRAEMVQALQEIGMLPYQTSTQVRRTSTGRQK